MTNLHENPRTLGPLITFYEVGQDGALVMEFHNRHWLFAPWTSFDPMPLPDERVTGILINHLRVATSVPGLAIVALADLLRRLGLEKAAPVDKEAL